MFNSSQEFDFVPRLLARQDTKSQPKANVTRSNFSCRLAIARQVTGRLQRVKPGLHINRKDRKHMIAKTDFKLSRLWLGLHIVVVITSIDLSQEILAIDVFTALKSSLKHRRKRWLQLYGDEAQHTLFATHLATFLGLQ